MKGSQLNNLNPFQLLRTQKVLRNNPTIASVQKSHPVHGHIELYSYNDTDVKHVQQLHIEQINKEIFNSTQTHWLNLDLIQPALIEQIAQALGIHYLIIEDILSKNERPKTDEIDDSLVIIMHMLYYNEDNKSIESEQVSFLLMGNALITFQDDAIRDTFQIIREKIEQQGSKVSTQKVDYLLYALIDTIVDQFYIVLEKMSIHIEKLEEDITQNTNNVSVMSEINELRKDLMYFKRHTLPVRDVLSNILKTDHPLIAERTKKYFKDVYDHVVQINDLTENYRDLITNIRDLYLSQMNTKMNEVMKFLAIVTTLLAPATVIGGIFGMNFDKIPYLHHQNGFWIASAFMLIIPLIMLYYFRKKGWF